jgi:choline dehydrogenase-like flavoprotein
VLTDARTLPDGTEIESDVCIVGGGAAGITIARELSHTPLRVCLLESGGLEFDPRTQALYRGEVIGFPYYDPDKFRLRFFGGTTNHWQGVCRPLDPLDFERRGWVPGSGWPFGRAVLEPYYARAQEICQLGPLDYDVSTWATENAAPFALPETSIESRAYQQSPPTRFGQVYREEIRAAANVSAYLHANVIEIETGSLARAVRRVRGACLTGNRFTARARWYVLATGAVENARLLLASRGTTPEGLGNRHGWVGRTFMEHISAVGAILLPSKPLDRSFYETHVVRGIPVTGHLALSPDLVRREKLLNAQAFVRPYTMKQTLRSSPALVSAKMAFESGTLDDDLIDHVRALIAQIDDLAIQSYDAWFGAGLQGFALIAIVEHAPRVDSRIMLGKERDALGLQRVRVDWQFGDLERRTLSALYEAIASTAGQAGLGRVRILPDDPEMGWPPGVRGAWHQMGTTRMDENPTRGVVNADCRVHGIENLFVAGSSVFPTSGYANPTLTLVALAVRLADHLKKPGV